jgi:MipA family protein
MNKLSACLACSALVAVAACLSQPALAQGTSRPAGASGALVPLPSVDDFTRGGDGWGVGLGLGLEYESAYEGSNEWGFEIEPAGAVQWRRGDDVFFWAGEALGWRGLRSGVWLLEAVVAFAEGRKESDSKKGRLKGLGNAEEGVEGVLQARRAFTADWRSWVLGRFVTGSGGNLALVGLGYRFGEQRDGTGSEINVALVLHDSERANKDFGVNASQSVASGLAQTRLKGGVRSLGINYVYRHELDANWQLFGEALYEHYSSGVQRSPIVRNTHEAEVSIGLLYRF